MVISDVVMHSCSQTWMISVIILYSAPPRYYGVICAQAFVCINLLDFNIICLDSTNQVHELVIVKLETVLFLDRYFYIFFLVGFTAVIGDD